MLEATVNTATVPRVNQDSTDTTSRGEAQQHLRAKHLMHESACCFPFLALNVEPESSKSQAASAGVVRLRPPPHSIQSSITENKRSPRPRLFLNARDDPIPTPSGQHNSAALPEQQGPSSPSTQPSKAKRASRRTDQLANQANMRLRNKTQTKVKTKTDKKKKKKKPAGHDPGLL